MPGPCAPSAATRRCDIDPHPAQLRWSRAAPATGVDPDAAPTFLLVHGVGLSHRSFSRLAGVLSREGSVLAPDLPGHGRAWRGTWRTTIDEIAEAVADGLARRLGGGSPGRGRGSGPVVALGHSLGSEVVTELALRHPDLVQGVVLVGPVVDPRARSAVGQGRRLALDVLGEPPFTGAMVTRDYLRAGPLTYAAGVASMLRYPAAERAVDLRQPTLVVRGAHDPIAPSRWVGQVRGLVHDGRELHVPGAGHNLVHSHPAEVGRAVVEFARGLGAAGGADAPATDATTADRRPGGTGAA